MGGGSSSQTITNVSTSTVVDVLTSNIMNCGSSTSARQRLLVSGNNNVLNGVSQTLTITLSSNCFQDAKNLAKVQQEVSQAIKNAAESQSVTITGALSNSSSNAETYIDTEVKQTITQKNLTNIINNVNTEQELVISGNSNIIKNISQNLTQDLVYKNAQTLLNTMKSIQALENSADTSSKATQKSLIIGLIDSLLSGISGIFGNFGVIFVIVIAIIVAGLFFARKEIMKVLGFGDDEKNQFRLPNYNRYAYPTTYPTAYIATYPTAATYPATNYQTSTPYPTTYPTENALIPYTRNNTMTIEEITDES